MRRLLACPVLLLAAATPAWPDTPVPVPTTTLTATTWRPTIQLAAQIDAQNAATLAAERPGRITAILFTSGQSVTAGTVLVKLDDAPEQAQLAQDQAKYTEAQNTLARAEKLMTIQGASQASLEQAEADMAEDRAQLAADNAALQQLNITAPFAGTLGIRRLSPGDYVTQGQTIVTLTQPAPLRILFAIPQTESAGVTLGEPFTLQAAENPQNPAAAAGRITALSPALDPATDARDAEGLITAGGGSLLPGMSGTVTLETGTPQPAYLVPDTALTDSVLGRYLFVLEPAGQNYTLHTVYVTQLAQSQNTAIIATSGLTPSATIVALGGFKLSDGAIVTPAPQ